MSRSNYSDDFDTDWATIRWRGAVASAIRGKRGQELLHGLASALDAMPEKRLIADALIDQDGSVCALGALGCARGTSVQDLAAIDPEDSEQVAKAFNVAEALAREVQYINDEAGWYDETPERRWSRVRAWVDRQIAARRVD